MTLEEEIDFEQIIVRLNQIDKEVSHVPVSAKIHKYLFENFLFRLKQEIKISNRENPKDYFSMLGDQFSIDLKSTIAEKVPSNFYSKFGRGGYYLIHLHIYWVLYSKKKSIELTRNPFEPVIRIFELNGVIEREGSSFETGNYRFTLNSKLNDEFIFLEDLSLSSLHRLVG